MSQEPGNSNPEEAVTVMMVPADKVQAVSDFLESLAEDESDVSGYMLSRGGFGGMAGAGKRLNAGISGTLCVTTGGGGTSDFNCTDND